MFIAALFLIFKIENSQMLVYRMNKLQYIYAV